MEAEVASMLVKIVGLSVGINEGIAVDADEVTASFCPALQCEPTLHAKYIGKDVKMC